MTASGLSEPPLSQPTLELPKEKSVSDRSPLFDLMNNTHGSFARIARIDRSVKTGVSTPSMHAGTTTLFPSMLPWKNHRVSLSMDEASDQPRSGRLWNGRSCLVSLQLFRMGVA